MKLDKYELKSGEQLEVLSSLALEQREGFQKLFNTHLPTTKICTIWALEIKILKLGK
jgi:hypothetical protein